MKKPRQISVKKKPDIVITNQAWWNIENKIGEEAMKKMVTDLKRAGSSSEVSHIINLSLFFTWWMDAGMEKEFQAIVEVAASQTASRHIGAEAAATKRAAKPRGGEEAAKRGEDAVKMR